MIVTRSPDSLASLVTPVHLRRLAGQPSFGRGQGYFDRGAVISLEVWENGIKAVVQGTRRYRVWLWPDGGELQHDCSCPMGDQGYFCKHCVAVGLAWHARIEQPDAAAARQKEMADTTAEIRRYLLDMEHGQLAQLLLDQAELDERLHRRLSLLAAKGAAGRAAAALWRRALDDALSVEDHVEYGEAYAYVRGIDDVIDGLEDMLLGGEALLVVELADEGLAEVAGHMEWIDDSDGGMTEIMGRLQALHLQACRVARPDPVELATRLFAAEMAADFEIFYGAVETYADVLGRTGLAAYRRLAEAEWAKVPPLAPGDATTDRYGRRYRITSIMTALARRSDDTEALVEIKARDLSMPYDFLKMAQIQQAAGRSEEALAWAERGWKTFADTSRDERLRTFIAEAYQAQGRGDEAVTLAWEAFAEDPALESFRQLRGFARDNDAWPEWREKALKLVRHRLADGTGHLGVGCAVAGAHRCDHSLLVALLLDDDDPEAAWDEARMGGCAPDLWLRLAATRSDSHPRDAVAVYQDHIAGLLRGSGDSIYRETIRVLSRIEQLALQLDEAESLRDYLAGLRKDHKRKRKLMAMLDERGW